MKLSNIVALGNGVYELEKGYGDRQLCEGDYVKLLFGSISTAPNAQAHDNGDDVSLPSALEDHRLATLYASYHGSYKNDKGEEYTLFSAALRAVQSMKEGDKVLIVEEEVDADLMAEGARGQRLSVVQVVQIIAGPPHHDKATREVQSPHNHAASSDRGRLGVDEIDTNNRPRKRGLSPVVPPGLFKSQALCVLVKLWRLRLCPGKIDGDVLGVLEEVNGELSATDHMLLCIGSWQFECSLHELDLQRQCNPTEPDWDLYRFTFHELLETESEELFASMQRCWNNYTRENITTDDIAQRWRNLNGAIGETIRVGLTARQYLCCNCAALQPHCSKDLDRSIVLLETLEKNETQERANQVAIAFTSLKVLDLIDQDNKESKHQSAQHCRYLAGRVLKELEDDRGVPEAMPARLKTIIVYEAERLRTVELPDLLAGLEIAKKVSA